jgi:hypothetical protein
LIESLWRLYPRLLLLLQLRLLLLELMLLLGER